MNWVEYLNNTAEKMIAGEKIKEYFEEELPHSLFKRDKESRSKAIFEIISENWCYSVDADKVAKEAVSKLSYAEEIELIKELTDNCAVEIPHCEGTWDVVLEGTAYKMLGQALTEFIYDKIVEKVY